MKKYRRGTAPPALPSPVVGPERKKKRAVFKIAAIFSLLVFAGCAAWLANEFLLQPTLSDEAQAEIKDVYFSSSSPSAGGTGASSGKQPSESPSDRIRSLQRINPDIVGWITVPNTVIDLPVVQAQKGDPDFYLTHDYRKKYSAYGTVFADYRGPVADPAEKSIILYGHSLISGRMFTQLKYCKSLDFYKTAPVVTFDSAQGSSKWKIISVFVTNTRADQGEPFDYIRTVFSSDADYLDFVYQLRIRSLYNTGVSFNAQDKILLLSTCSYEFDGFREVVAARKVRAGEAPAVKTEAAANNANVLYPDCWYKKYGGTKPDWPADYAQARSRGLLSWDES